MALIQASLSPHMIESEFDYRLNLRPVVVGSRVIHLQKVKACVGRPVDRIVHTSMCSYGTTTRQTRPDVGYSQAHISVVGTWVPLERR